MIGYKKLYNEIFGLLPPIKVNIDFIMSLWNGLVIVDEVHNTYNSQEVNTWGESLMLISSLL